MNASDSTARPNVIWILADQMRGQAMGLRGDPNVATPHLDRLAYEGTYFPNALSGTPLCTPARGSFLTGRYPHNSTAPTHDSPLDPSRPTLANVFRESGYRTCYIGKWHLDGHRPELDHDDPENDPRHRIIPPERRGGFEDWFGFELNNRPYDTWINCDIEGVPSRKRLEGYQTDVLTDVLLDWLGERGAEGAQPEQPFFAVLSVEPPHNPYVAPAAESARHIPGNVKFRPNVPDVAPVRDLAQPELAGYYASIERLDWNVGRVREALTEMGIAENTYIVFFSDHGDMHGSHGQFRKTSPWEESIRIPFIISGPSREHQWLARSSADSLVNHVDVAPTTLGLCGIDTPEWMEGFDYSARVFDQGPPSQTTEFGGEPEDAYLSLPIPTGHGDSIDRPYRGVVTKSGWKYVCLEGQPWQMFDLNVDPYEQVNLAHNAKYRVRRAQLQRTLEAWIERTGDEFALPAL